ncbi:MAG: PTS sugar transporter subunit IIA [Thiohalobacteraceae bacterium]
MHIASLLSPARVVCCQQTTSKKRALEQLSELLSQDAPNLTTEEIFDSLIARERLGSTGLGQGVAIPHGRMSGLQEPLGACIRLTDAIDFEALDNKPVDILFALMVPAESTSEHLQLLAQLARMFSDAGFTQRLRETGNSKDLLQLLQHWEADRTNA